MLHFYQKGTWRSFVYSPVMVGILLIGIILLSIAVYNRYVAAREMAERRQELETDLRVLEARKEEMQNRVDYLSHERGIEAEMRRNFDVAEANEKVVIIVEDESTSNIEPLAPVVPKEEKPWYIFWR